MRRWWGNRLKLDCRLTWLGGRSQWRSSPRASILLSYTRRLAALQPKSAQKDVVCEQLRSVGASDRSGHSEWEHASTHTTKSSCSSMIRATIPGPLDHRRTGARRSTPRPSARPATRPVSPPAPALHHAPPRRYLQVALSWRSATGSPANAKTPAASTRLATSAARRRRNHPSPPGPPLSARGAEPV